MKRLDRWIRAWRIRRALPYIPRGGRVLDLGCGNGELFHRLVAAPTSLGVDPTLSSPGRANGIPLLPGSFPGDVPGQERFDCITMLAVLEHIPREQQPAFAEACFRRLVSGGSLVITVPSAAVDRILAVLRAVRLIDGMSLEEHYGFDVSETVPLFETAGFRLERHTRFQLGLNNLFVFSRPSRPDSHTHPQPAASIPPPLGTRT